jgi:ParB family transcriptional regulator, chromosome partitioning protein
MAKPLERTNASRLKETSKANAALFGDLRGAARVLDVPVNRVEPNPNQPRRQFDEESLRDLAASLERHGLQQPIGVQDLGVGQYQLVYGERRLRAAALLGWELIPAMVVRADQDAAEIALIENLQRVDLTPFEIGDGLTALLHRHEYKHTELGKLIGKSESYVSRVLRLSALPHLIREEYEASGGKASMSALIEIAEADPATMLELWALVREGAGVIALRETKKQREMDVSQPSKTEETANDMDGGSLEGRSPSYRFTRSVERLDHRLEKMINKRVTLDDLQRDRLRALRSRIDALLGE